MFFTALTVAFGAAVWVRVGSYGGLSPEPQQTAALGERTRGDARVLSDGTTPAGSEGTMEPFPGDTSEAAQRARGMSPREQRYNELLRSAPPAPAPKQPSLLDRMVAPFASALGMNRPKPPAAAPASPQPQRPQPQQASNERQHADSGEGKSSRRDPQEEQDPDTDITPPTLQAAEFVPAQVHDGEETTLTVIVSDNLSGVRSVSGVVASPSGALQGFSCRLEGEMSRYTAKIVVPKDAAEGVWAVKYMTLSDNASNNVNLNAAQGALPPGASFRVVSSGSDSKGPELRSVAIDRTAMRAGERNTLYVEADDDKSGVGQVSGVFVSPGKSARIGFGCRPGEGGMWECPIASPTCLDCGLWELEQIQLQDKANNMSSFRMDNQIVARIKLDINGDSCDSAPPTIQSLVLSPTVISNAEDSTIRVEAILVDDGCGVASLSGQATPAGNVGGQRAHFSFDPSPDGRTFVGNIPIPKHSAKGVWLISWMQVLDKGNNLRSYSPNDPVIARATFRVE